MKIGKQGINLIKSFEGFEPKVYLDSAGLPTIGYGTLIDTPEEDHWKIDSITEEVAEQLLIKDASKAEWIVNVCVKKVLNQNQYDSLVSFAYNAGSGNFKSSTLLKLINNDPSDPLIKPEFEKWCHAGGKVVQGLINRRKKEAELYFTPVV